MMMEARMDLYETTNGWPDPQQPGVPKNPDRDGTHLLKQVDTGLYVLAMWCAARQSWSHASLDGYAAPRAAALQYEYCGPAD
jgi:hypothetical protein